jgi:hypothetical protein
MDSIDACGDEHGEGDEEPAVAGMDQCVLCDPPENVHVDARQEHSYGHDERSSERQSHPWPVCLFGDFDGLLRNILRWHDRATYQNLTIYLLYGLTR